MLPIRPTNAQVVEHKQLIADLQVNIKEKKLLITRIRRKRDELLTGCHPAVNELVTELLTTKDAEKRKILDWWHKRGFVEGAEITLDGLTKAANSTMSAFGVACLISYAEGAEAWLVWSLEMLEVKVGEAIAATVVSRSASCACDSPSTEGTSSDA